MQEKAASLAQGRPYKQKSPRRIVSRARPSCKQKVAPPHRKPHDLKAAFATASLRRFADGSQRAINLKRLQI